MAKYIIKAADIELDENVFIQTGENVLREAKLVKRVYDANSLSYYFMVAGLEEEAVISEPQGSGYQPKKFYRTTDDALNGTTIPLVKINLADKLSDAGFNVTTDDGQVVMAMFNDFKLTPKYITIYDAKFTETCDSLDVDFRQYKTITIEGVICYQYDGCGFTAFKSDEDALKAKPIKIYRF